MRFAVCVLPLLISFAGAQDDQPTFGVFLWHESPNDAAALEGIVEALRDWGVPHALAVEQANESPERARAILDAFEARPVDLLFAMGTQAALIAREQIEDIPVVFTAVTNPVESGVVPSWRGSGRNLAGNSNWIPSETVLHVFQLAIPDLASLGILRSKVSGVVSGAELREMRRHLAGSDAAIQLHEEVVQDAEGIGEAVRRLAARGVDAIWIPIDFTIYENMDRVVVAALSEGLPLVSSSLRGAEEGAITGVLVDYAMLGGRAVVIARRIVEEGADPGSMEIETMSGYQVVANLDAAARSGYRIPLSLLVLADRLIDDENGPVRRHGR